jgi:hypothetical protein
MSIIGLETYKIDFRILPNDLKTIILVDLSNYLSTPEKPKIEVVLPGFTGSVEFSYVPNTLIVIDSDDLRLTYTNELGPTADLPDGIYQITMKVCPYDELFNKKCYLKTTKLESDYQKLLLSLDLGCGCYDENKLKEAIIDLDILIQSAKAEADICNTEKAAAKYAAAVSKLEYINNRLNCD